MWCFYPLGGPVIVGEVLWALVLSARENAVLSAEVPSDGP